MFAEQLADDRIVDHQQWIARIFDPVKRKVEGLDGRFRCAMRDASSMPGRRRPAQHSSARAMEIGPLFLPHPQGPTTRTNAGRRHSSPWTQGQRMRRIKRTRSAVRPLS